MVIYNFMVPSSSCPCCDVACFTQTAEVSKNAGAAAAGKSYDVVAGSVTAVTSRLPSVPLPTLKKGKDKKD